MPLVDPLALLRRQDKWYLGNGGMLVYAPSFPRYLHVPGFWDECHYGDLAIEHLLAVNLACELDGGLAELTPRLISWQWQPDRIEATHALGIATGIAGWRPVGLTLSEVRRLSPDGTLCCELTLHRADAQPAGGTPPKVVHIIAWTMRETKGDNPASGFTEVKEQGRAIAYTQHAKRRSHQRGGEPLLLEVRIQGNREPDSLQVTPSHGSELVPRLPFTPFWDGIRHDGKLTDEVLGDPPLGRLAYAGLHWCADLDADDPYQLTVQVAVRDPQVALRLFPDSGVHGEVGTPDPTQAWREFLDLVPHFECSDEMLTRYYWYRWYGLRLNAVPAGGNYAAPGVTEGITYFRGVITYSLMCHVFDCQWLSDPALAQGCLRNHLAHQTEAGHFPGHIFMSGVNTEGFYHTDIGHAAGDLLAHHPDAAFAREITPGLTRLLDYYLRERDSEGLALYDVRDQFETGQEFTSRYFHAHPEADLFGWEHQLRLKGVDVTAYVYHLARLLEHLAADAGDDAAAHRHGGLAGRIKVAVRGQLWDGERGFFFDYSTEKGERSPYWTAVGFYPLLSSLATPEQARACAAHLLGGDKFDTPWPTPTVPRDDPYFSAAPRWRGERANCPWNGRVWPMVNSHVVEVLGRLAEQWPGEYRQRLAAYLRRYIEMMHYEQPGQPGAKDYTRPNCFEHYDPLDGSACEYRGIDDYMHSWVADHILRWVAGVRLLGNRLTVDPLPFGLTHMLLRDCRIAGHRLDVCLGRTPDGGYKPGFRIHLDSVVLHSSEDMERWEVLV